LLISCFPNFFNGSPKTQNIKDAIAHAESGKPLARVAAQQMSAVWKQLAIAHRLPILRLLSRATGPDVGRQVTVGVALWATLAPATLRAAKRLQISLCNQSF
jgi:hypothetical protein